METLALTDVPFILTCMFVGAGISEMIRNLVR